MIEYDIVYRYCSPEESSGDGKKIRSRDNNELAHSIISLGLLTDKFQKIFIIHRGPPPAHCVQQSVEQVIFIQEKELLEKSVMSTRSKWGLEIVRSAKWVFS